MVFHRTQGHCLELADDVVIVLFSMLVLWIYALEHICSCGFEISLHVDYSSGPSTILVAEGDVKSKEEGIPDPHTQTMCYFPLCIWLRCTMDIRSVSSY
jgi:hypothetical protein